MSFSEQRRRGIRALIVGVPPHQTSSAAAIALASRLPHERPRGPMCVLADVMSGTALVLITLFVSVMVGAVLVNIATAVVHWTTMLIERL